MKEFLGSVAYKSLRTLDLFGGVGAFGLSMEESGCLKVTHAVEISPSAAKTFKLGHVLPSLPPYLNSTVQAQLAEDGGL